MSIIPALYPLRLEATTSKVRPVIRLVSLIRGRGESRIKGLPVLHDPTQRILHFGLDAGKSTVS
jgi:hypothetical protein